MRVLAPLLVVLGAAAFLGELPRRARRLRRDARRRGAELDVDPFAVLGLDAAALAAMDPRSRDAAVRAAYRAAALASHPDTSATERGDRFALVKRAADALRREDDFERLARAHAAARDDSLAALWRDEVREWSVERLAAHLRDEGAPEPVVAAFVEEDVDGREVVGVPQWEGDDVDHFIWALRWLGTEDEAVAARTEKILRDLAGRERGANFVRRDGAQGRRADRTNF
jgi:curved DNA-binding protein CbpA